jgi:hypothetical protein
MIALITPAPLPARAETWIAGAMFAGLIAAAFDRTARSRRHGAAADASVAARGLDHGSRHLLRHDRDGRRGCLLLGLATLRAAG